MQNTEKEADGNMKRRLLAGLLLLLSLTVFAGCEQKLMETTKHTETTKPIETTRPTETTQPTEPAPTAYQFPKGAQLDVFSGHASAMPDTMLNDFIEDATGLDILWLTAPDFYSSGALMADRVMPSLVFTTSRAGLNELGRYGVYVNLWDYQDIMPNFFAHFNSEAYADYKKAYMPSEDELYCAPVFVNGSVQHYGWIYREDIFRELNLAVPSDWDSFYAVLKALKAAYPDSYPFAMRNMTGNITGFTELAQQFGVDYRAEAPALDHAAGKYYDPYTTDAMREMLKKLALLIDEGLMDAACLSYDTAMWQRAIADGHAFVTHDKAFQLGNLEAAGKQVNPGFSMNWFNNIPMTVSDLPYAIRAVPVQNYCWYVTTTCANVELALRYLDWMYSEEGIRILSWGVKGKSYGENADGSKYFLENYDRTYQARYQESGYIDFTAILTAYDEKTKAMILDTMQAAAEGGFYAEPTLDFQREERDILNIYKQSWLEEKNTWLQGFLQGKYDINKDAVWQAFKDALAAQHFDEVIAVYDAAYARYIGST